MRALTAVLLVALAALVGCATNPDTSSSGVPATSTYIPAPASEVRPVKVSIPALQVEANIIDLGLQADGTMAVPPDAKDAGWYTNSPAPGRPGPSVLVAHVNWKGEDGPFAKLHELKAGDQVLVEDADGAQVQFVVDRVETHDKNAFPADEVYADTAGPELRLVTCTGEFDATSHSYRDNLIVFAHLVT